MSNSLPNNICRGIDAISEWTGRAMAWLVLLMVAIIVYDVGMRYVFHISSGALQELEWHLFALVFLLGASYTLKHDAHVRVDILYSSRWMTARRRAYVDLFGVLFLLIPFCVLVIVSSLPFVASAFSMGEGSSDAGGLPYRFLIKSAIPVGFALLLLQGVAQLLRTIMFLANSATNSAVPPNKDAKP